MKPLSPSKSVPDKYGYFADDKKEYIITNPRTPVKWINYIGTLAFGGFVDATGGAAICKGDPGSNRITRYIQQMPSSDFKGETLYVRIRNKNGTYKVFSPFFVPCLLPYDNYECHVGMGYTRIVSEYFGLHCEVTIFVPINDGIEIRDISIKNISDKPIEVDLIPVIEYSHFNAQRQFDNADWVPQTMQSFRIDGKDGRTILTQAAFMKKFTVLKDNTAINFFTSNAKATSFETSRPKFLGDNECGSWAHPLSLDNEELSNYEALRGDNIAALMHHFGALAPRKSIRLITQLGQEKDNAAIGRKAAKYSDSKTVDAAFASLTKFWASYLSKVTVNTPDVDLNRMISIYNPRQCFITFNWSRYLSLYQLGNGQRELGYRDSSQDVMGVLDRDPESAKELIVKLLSVQKRNGSALHQFNPLTMIGAIGDSSEESDKPKYYSDDHLWAVLAVCAYIKETGDVGFLKTVVPFYDKDKQGNSLEKGTVLAHLERAVEFTKGDAGKHSLPLLGYADWNDSVNLRTGAESMFTACLYGKALLEMIELSEFRKDGAALMKFSTDYKKVKDAYNKFGWDGKWYVRYFDFDGTPLGSKKNKQGKIYINSQSWAVIARFAPADRANDALDSVYKYLNTSKGLKLSTPGFNAHDPHKGGLTTYPPGAKENGGIFLHTNPWVMIAETLRGNGNRAYEYYAQINPVSKNDIIDEFECEPYVYPQNILGDEHPQFGLARNSWLSGTGSWAYQAATKYILGVQPTYAGLRIDPCIPSEWKKFSMKRMYRGATYHINVVNPGGKSKGEVALTVDGKKIKGAVIKAFTDGKEHKVEVEIL
jgi:cellobiose phosphorylase